MQHFSTNVLIALYSTALPRYRTHYTAYQYHDAVSTLQHVGTTTLGAPCNSQYRTQTTDGRVGRLGS
eukprot:547438-Rhodomonas_salina.1